MDKDIRKPAAIGYTPMGSDENMTGGPSSPTPRATQSIEPKVEILVDQGHEADETDERAPLLGGPANTDRARPSTGFVSSVKRRISKAFGPSTVTEAQAAPQKRIVLPVRIEPKVFFANERTFLSWLHFCIVLGGLALGLLNFGDQVGQISGLIFTLVAMMFIIYALFLYQWRAHQIRNRRMIFLSIYTIQILDLMMIVLDLLCS